MTIGQHSYDFDDTLQLTDRSKAKGGTATLTFSHFPDSVEEFQTLQEQLLGTSPAGCLALNLLAYEMFRRNREIGEACIRLCNTPANASATLRMLKEKFSQVRHDASDHDTYHQPYLVASFLKGATQTNGYQPEEPYTLTFYLSDNPNTRQHERSSLLSGFLYRISIRRNGTQEHEATVLVPDGEMVVLAHNTSNFYVAVPPVKKWDDTLK